MRPRINEERVMELPVTSTNAKQFEEACQDEKLTFRFLRTEESFKIYEVHYLRDWELFYLGRRYGTYVLHDKRVLNNQLTNNN